jgi:hypothetical protein
MSACKKVIEQLMLSATAALLTCFLAIHGCAKETHSKIHSKRNTCKHGTGARISTRLRNTGKSLAGQSAALHRLGLGLQHPN